MTGQAQTDPMDTIRQFVEAFNNDDVELAEAACADRSWIIDDFPPYVWDGERATTKWLQDMDRMSAQYGMSEPSVALREPLQAEVEGHSTYLVVPIDVRWRQKGAPAERTGYMTVVLNEGAAGWRISACAWTWD